MVQTIFIRFLNSSQDSLLLPSLIDTILLTKQLTESIKEAKEKTPKSPKGDFGDFCA